MKTHNMIRRACQLALAALIVIGVSVGLSACKNDEQMARDSAEAMFKAFKNPTEESMRPYMSNAKTPIISQIESYNIDVYEFLGHVFRHFDYRIDKVTVTGNTASIEASFNNANLSSAFANANTDYQSTDTATLAQIYQDGKEAGLEKKLMELFYKRLDEATDLTPTKATIKLTKENGSWKVDDGSVQDFASSMYGSISLSGEVEPASQSQEQPASESQESASE